MDDDGELQELRWHWGEAYLIEYFPNAEKWIAQRRDSHATLRADGPDSLLDAIREDYRRAPVPRSPAGGSPGCRFTG